MPHDRSGSTRTRPEAGRDLKVPSAKSPPNHFYDTLGRQDLSRCPSIDSDRSQPPTYPNPRWGEVGTSGHPNRFPCSLDVEFSEARARRVQGPHLRAEFFRAVFSEMRSCLVANFDERLPKAKGQGTFPGVCTLRPFVSAVRFWFPAPGPGIRAILTPKVLLEQANGSNPAVCVPRHREQNFSHPHKTGLGLPFSR